MAFHTASTPRVGHGFAFVGNGRLQKRRGEEGLPVAVFARTRVSLRIVRSSTLSNCAPSLEPRVLANAATHHFFDSISTAFGTGGFNSAAAMKWA